VPTTDAVRRALAGRPPGAAGAQAEAKAAANRFFHWPLEFPHVFADGGFDVVVGNPPWDMVQLDPREFFATRVPEIAARGTMAERDKMIAALANTHPQAYKEFQDAQHDSDSYKKFLHSAERFPLSSSGRINLMAVFAELGRKLISPTGYSGMVLPTGITTNSFTQPFFADLVRTRSLAQIIGFENEAFIFPAVHHAFKFCVLTIAGTDIGVQEGDFVFLCRRFSDVQQEERHFKLSVEDFELLNPNTSTIPIFRTKRDADLTRKIYGRVPVLWRENSDEGNPWGISFKLAFMMNTDSVHFRTEEDFGKLGGRKDRNRYIIDKTLYLPLYEGKMMHQFDHRYATYEGATQANLNAGILPQTTAAQKGDPSFAVRPRYWVEAAEVEARLREWKRGWLLGFRDITSAVVERTAIFSLLPRVGMGNKIPLLMLENDSALLAACLLANFNSLPFDYVARQKIAGTTLNFFIVKQFPVLPPDHYTARDQAFIVPRVLELVYTSWDMAAFAADVWAEGDEALRAAIAAQREANRAATGGHAPDPAHPDAPFPPFKWDDARRARLRAELDATYARLYGLTRDELRYILDPADVHGPAFPGETFRVLKEKEMKALGEYRTGRLVLAAWDEMTN
jgi:hypothetical protein